MDALLLAVVLTEVKILIPPWSFIALNTNQSGEAFNLIDWSWTSLPSSDFCLAFWVYVSTAVECNSGIFSIQLGDRSDFMCWNNDDSLAWYDNVFLLDGSPLVVSRTTSSPKVWFHFVLTSDGSSLCEVLTLRVGNQNQRCQDTTFTLDSTTQIIAPAIFGTPIIVKSM